MNISDILAVSATVAGIAMALSNVFQARKIFRRKSAMDISKSTYIILTLSSLVWVTYGISINNIPIIVSNGIGVVITAVILVGCSMHG